jgi:hypothetical protein
MKVKFTTPYYMVHIDGLGRTSIDLDELGTNYSWNLLQARGHPSTIHDEATKLVLL